MLQVEAAPYDCPIRFQRQWADQEIGLHYNFHRYYDQAAIQHASADPIGLEGGIRQSAYVADPSRLVDPLGLAAAGPANFMGDKDNFFKYASRRSDTDSNGRFDLIARGSPDKIQIMTKDGPILITHREAAKLIRSSPGYKNKQPIRLLSCSTGACDIGFAQNLSIKLGVPVSAPTDLVWAYPNGQMAVAPRLPSGGRNLSQTGSFKTFVPGGR